MAKGVVPIMNYEEALEFLRDLTKFGYNFGLGRIAELLKELDNPQQKLKIIHIGGTNGKGSTAAMVAAILKAAGYKTALFSSPHLHNYTERMRINGEEIPRAAFASLVARLKPVLEKMVAAGFEHPTEFEVNTAIAFLYFAEEEVDFVALEVGLGGIIDSTNVAESLVSVITNVGMDHMDYLGNDLESIARVKAGIIKSKNKVVTATELPEVLKIIQEAAREKQAELMVFGQQFKIEILSSDLSGISFNYRGFKASYLALKTPLLGEHQGVNAATAVAVMECLSSLGYSITEQAIRDGLEKVVWLGRLEILHTRPTVLIDAAHNVDGALTLRKALKELFIYNRLILILGMLADKEREKVLAILAPLADGLILTKPNSPRAGDWEAIGDLAKSYVQDLQIIPDIKQAIKKGLLLTEKGDLFCVTGSIYMIAEARNFLLEDNYTKFDISL